MGFGAWFIGICLHFIGFLLPALAATGIILGFERGFLFHRARLKPETLLAGLKNLLDDGRLGEALRLCKQTPGPLPRVLNHLLGSEIEDPHRAEDDYLRQAQWEQMLLERHMGTIALVAKLLPLIGCVGTLLALMSCFFAGNRLDTYVTVGTFAPSVANAFWMAICGTVGAIAMNLGYHYLHSRLNTCLREIYSGADELYVHRLSLAKEKQPCENDDSQA